MGSLRQRIQTQKIQIPCASDNSHISFCTYAERKKLVRELYQLAPAYAYEGTAAEHAAMIIELVMVDSSVPGIRVERHALE